MADEKEKIDEIIKLSRIKAEAKAAQGQGVVGVASVFRGKGVPADRATAEAEQIVAAARVELRKREMPRRVFAWALLVTGIGAFLYTIIGLIAGFVREFEAAAFIVPAGLIFFGVLILQTGRIGMGKWNQRG